MKFGEKIKELRENKGLLQRQLAANLEIDTPMFSKIERGERKAKREQVVLLSKLLNFKEDELLTIWLADQVYDLVAKENNAINALKLAENQLKRKRK
jgi:transcriptional regulator with XRE-family HTH domain